MNNPNISQSEINRLKQEVYDVVAEKLRKDGLGYSAQVIIYDDVMTTGVQGDDRTYCPLVEITLLERERIVWDKKFAVEISTEVVNRVSGTNRVVMTIPINESISSP